MKSNLVLISYPSGGFGNFLFHTLTTYADQTYKTNKKFEFSLSGNSHNTHKYTSIYFQDPESYQLNIPDPEKITLVLCDNGITDDSYTNIHKTFADPKTILRVCIDYNVRPIVYQTCVIKAMRSTLLDESQSHVNNHWIDADTDYAKRENFTLLYHNWPFNWEPRPDTINISLEQLILDPVSSLLDTMKQIGCSCIDLSGLTAFCDEWKKINSNYFEPYNVWKTINNCLESGNDTDLSHVTELHTQGYINYCLEKKFNISIPVFDYRNWFNNTQEIKQMIKDLT